MEATLWPYGKCVNCANKNYCVWSQEEIINCMSNDYPNYTPVEIKKPMTKADRIRSMSDEELAELLLHRIDRNGDCPVSVVTKYCKTHNCHQCWLDWLRQEVKDGV